MNDNVSASIYLSNVTKNKTVNKPKKYNIILDLDDCIIHSESNFSLFYEDKYFTNGPYKYILWSYLYPSKYSSRNDEHMQFITYLRPNLKNFLTFIFKNFNVGIWTTGTVAYAKNLIKSLFLKLYIEDNYDELIFFIARCDRSIKNNKNTSYDIINNKFFDNMSNGNIVKDMNLLFSDSFYKDKKIYSHNTLLIDDNLSHNGINNGNNIISVAQYIYHNTCDDILLQLIEYLTSLLLQKNKVNISTIKLKQFLNPTSKDIKNMDQRIYTKHNIHQFNKICKPVKPIKPVKASKPVKAVKPVKPIEPVKAVKSVKASKLNTKPKIQHTKTKKKKLNNK